MNESTMNGALWLAVPLAALLASCDSTSSDHLRSEDTAGRSYAVSLHGPERIPIEIPPGSIDDEFRGLAREIAGFGGAFFQDDRLVVRVKQADAVDGAHVRRVLTDAKDFRSAFQSRNGLLELQFVESDYSYVQLSDWMSLVLHSGRLISWRTLDADGP